MSLPTVKYGLFGMNYFNFYFLFKVSTFLMHLSILSTMSMAVTKFYSLQMASRLITYISIHRFYCVAMEKEHLLKKN